MIGRVKLPSQHTGQRLVRKESRRYNWLCAGRRWRKSSLLMALSVEAGLAGKRVLCGSPTFDQTRILWDYSRKALGEVGSINKTRLEIELPNQGKIIYRSFDDPTHIRGHSADLILVDEAPLVKPEVWHEALLPMLVDSGGSGWLSGTPSGRGWFWVEHQLQGDDRMSWQIPTAGMKIIDNQLIESPNKYSNPHIPFSEMVKYYNRVPQQTFRQEFLAEFIEDGGLVFRVIPTGAKVEEKRQGSWKYIVGVDLAKYNDWTVFSVINATHNTQCHIERMNKVDYTFQLERLCLLNEKFKPEVIVVEANAAGTPFIELMEQRGLPVVPFTTTNKSKKEVIEMLALAFERGELTILDDKIQTNELSAFEVEKLPSGKLRYAAPKGVNFHDDTVIALALSWWGVKEEEGSVMEFGTSEFLSSYRG